MPERPEFVPEKYWDPENDDNNKPELLLERVSKGYNEAASLVGQKESAIEERLLKRIEEQRRAEVPATPKDYKLEFGELPLPEGAKFEMPEDDELLGEFRQVAHEIGLKPEHANRLLNLYGRAVLSTLPDPEAEKAALGENYDARRERVDGILSKKLPKDLYQALGNESLTATQFKAIEQLANAVSGMNGSQTEEFGDTNTGAAKDALESELNTLMNDKRYWQQGPESRHIQERVRKIHEILHGTAPFRPQEG